MPLFPYGEEMGDSHLAKEDDDCGPVMSSPIDIPIYGIPHRNWIVSNVENGLLCTTLYVMGILKLCN